MPKLLHSNSQFHGDETFIVPTSMHRDEVVVDEELVRRLLREQMPDLLERTLTIVEPWGTDNAIWRLGDDLVVRFPRIHWATPP